MTRDREKGAGGLARLDRRPKLAQEVAATIRQAILSGEFSAGEHLHLESIAAQLGVSVMPVREALINLHNEGLVSISPRRGFTARPLGARDWDDLFRLQGHLAGLLAERAAEIVTDDDISRLKAIHAEFVETSGQPMTAGRAARLTALNREFHHAISTLGDAGRLRWFLRMTSRFLKAGSYRVLAEWIEMSLREHPQIIEALAARDGVRAGKLIEAHYKNGSQMMADHAPPAAPLGKAAHRKADGVRADRPGQPAAAAAATDSSESIRK